MEQSLEEIIRNLKIYEFIFSIISNPYYITFICIIVPITMFICIIFIYSKINIQNKKIENIEQNQKFQIEQNERIITLLEEIKNKDYSKEV